MILLLAVALLTATAGAGLVEPIETTSPTVYQTLEDQQTNLSIIKNTGLTNTAPISAPRHIFFNVANDAGVKYNLDGAAYGGPNNTYYIKADGGGLNELHITNDVNLPYGQATTSSSQSGTFYVTNTGGRGFDDDIILLLSVKGPIPDDFAIHVKSSGYDMTTGTVVNAPPTEYHHVTGAVDETFTKADFIYGPQTWKPGPGSLTTPSLPLYYGQSISDQSTNSYLMFIDLKVGNLYPSKFRDATLTDNGAAKVEYSISNLGNSFAAFNGYGWCRAANQGQGISWTNRVEGNSNTVSGYSVIGKPSAAFSATPLSGAAPLSVQFTDRSTNLPTIWAWDFNNDGIVDSTDQNPSYTFPSAGRYTVKLTATNILGSDTYVATNCITSSMTAAFYAYGSVGQAPYSVKFEDQSVGSPTAWKWDFGDNTTSTEQNPTHVFNQTGVYNVALTASNDQMSDTCTKYRCIIVNTVPVAAFTANATAGRTPFTVQFTDQSTDSSGFEWRFGDGTTSTEQNPVHTYTKPGAYTVTLTASQSNFGSVFTEKPGYITVTDPPTAGFSANVTTGLSPLSVQFNESVTGSVQYYFWHFGDGATSFDQNPVHIYDTVGTYTVSLMAIGPNGNEVKTIEDCINVTAPVTPTPTPTATVTPTVTPTPSEQNLPVADFTVTPQGGQGSFIFLVTDTAVNATSVKYDLGDGTCTAYPNFRYTYWQPGTFTITQTATNAAGSSTKSVTVTVPAGA
jgi:PKD repeat protein